MYSIQADSDLGDNQSVWKRVFQGIMDRADTYRFTGFVNLHDAVEAVHVETYYDLCEKHNSLNLERDELVEAFDSKNKNRDTSTDDDSVAVGTENLNSELAVLVARASNHNARAKVFSFNVLVCASHFRALAPPLACDMTSCELMQMRCRKRWRIWTYTNGLYGAPTCLHIVSPNLQHRKSTRLCLSMKAYLRHPAVPQIVPTRWRSPMWM
ncbi:hypothetical protein BDW22DRAFT_563510 [Trametopsis cervina]|nr:hypothetical protein BDW22DRAFT_563510 [Trametopsis cervina]